MYEPDSVNYWRNQIDHLRWQYASTQADNPQREDIAWALLRAYHQCFRLLYQQIRAHIADTNRASHELRYLVEPLYASEQKQQE